LRQTDNYALQTEGDMSERIDELRWKKFSVLDDGFVCLVDVMGNDAAVVQAARVSYGEGTRKVSDDRTLIRYLMRHRHTTPFEMAELKFLVRVPMDCWRQWIRHRTANVNEYSTRYSEAIDSMAVTAPDEWRMQAGSNKQGSDGYVTEWPEGWVIYSSETHWLIYPPDAGRIVVRKADVDTSEGSEITPGQLLSHLESLNQEHLVANYKLRLAFGVAREQARKDLPLSTYTEAYWKIDLHNLLHFLALRMDSHAQQEIREYATTIGEQIVRPLFPLVWEAFLDYRFNAITLTAIEQQVMSAMILAGNLPGPLEDLKHAEYWPAVTPFEWLQPKCRERAEFEEKLMRMGLLTE
jgi:thymidylate synthase (FAD)